MTYRIEVHPKGIAGQTPEFSIAQTFNSPGSTTAFIADFLGVPRIHRVEMEFWGDCVACIYPEDNGADDSEYAYLFVRRNK